jgi:hypothetical protein
MAHRDVGSTQVGVTSVCGVGSGSQILKLTIACAKNGCLLVVVQKLRGAERGNFSKSALLLLAHSLRG